MSDKTTERYAEKLATRNAHLHGLLRTVSELYKEQGALLESCKTERDLLRANVQELARRLAKKSLWFRFRCWLKLKRKEKT